MSSTSCPEICRHLVQQPARIRQGERQCSHWLVLFKDAGGGLLTIPNVYKIYAVDLQQVDESLLLPEQAPKIWSWVSCWWVKASTKAWKFHQKKATCIQLKAPTLTPKDPTHLWEHRGIKERPTGREHAKWVDVINPIVDKISEESTEMHQNTIKSTLLYFMICGARLSVPLT